MKIWEKTSLRSWIFVEFKLDDLFIDLKLM